ncbi:hypothetical protein BM1_10582 [Bipolaris maydis]|nr:hypothetical protein BM1_10582 [Bipolaris maydis]
MVRRSPTHALRTCTSFFTSATSPSWPGPTRPTTIKLLCLATLLAATQLGLCAALAHKLLAMRLEVECWEVDDEHAGEGGSAGLDMLSLVPKTHKLPVTMIGYFFMALFAARMNQLDRQRPIGLQNLAPSRRTGVSGNAAAVATAAPQYPLSYAPSVPAPSAFSVSSRLPRQHNAADARGRKPAERKEENVDPFTDPQNVVV